MKRLLLATLLVAACGTPANESLEAAPRAAEREDAIINGEACAAGEEPTSVAILVDAKFTFGPHEMEQQTVICTGTLIAPDVVLTAAHCIDPTAMTGGFGTVERAEFFVSFQSDLTALAEQRPGSWPSDAIKAKSVVKHPGFDLNQIGATGPGPGDYKDIGLIFLPAPLAQKPEIVITQAEAEAHIGTQQPVRIVGWGQQTASQDSPPGTVGRKVCGDSFINEVGVAEMQIGGDSTTERKCHGDSGGPSFLVLDANAKNGRRVVGVTSHAYDQTDCAKGGVDTRVDTYLPWIEAEMSKGCTLGSRAWCEVKGIIPASFYDAKPEEPKEQEQPLEPGGGGDVGSRSRTGGCDVTGASAFALAGLVAALRRRRAQAN